MAGDWIPSGLPGYHAIEWAKGMERGQAVWDRIVTPPPTFHSPPCLKVPTLLTSGLGEHPWYLRQAQGGVQADGGTGRGRQGWLVTPSDCRRRGVNGGKGRVLSVGQEARGCGQHKRGNLAQSENGAQETPLSPDILPRYTPPLRFVPLRPGPSAHARRGWPLRRQEPGKTRHMQYTTPSRKGGFGEDSSFPQDPSRSHLETTLKWRTPPPPSLSPQFRLRLSQVPAIFLPPMTILRVHVCHKLPHAWCRLYLHPIVPHTSHRLSK